MLACLWQNLGQGDEYNLQCIIIDSMRLPKQNQTNGKRAITFPTKPKNNNQKKREGKLWVGLTATRTYFKETDRVTHPTFYQRMVTEHHLL